jgi:hypothetical protein
MATAPEFWGKESLREKTKSPFELAISSVRALDARIVAPYPLYTWITRMGQQLYYYQAPTGFPDRGQYWINTGSLLNRMNFGLALASNRIPGVQVDLAALNNHHEPESSEHALRIYSKLLMPGRNTDETVKRLQPLLQDPELADKIEAAAQKNKAPGEVVMEMNEVDEETMMTGEGKKKKNQLANAKPGKKGGLRRNTANGMVLAAGNNSMLSQVVGIILGSPEFQRK